MDSKLCAVRRDMGLGIVREEFYSGVWILKYNERTKIICPYFHLVAPVEKLISSRLMIDELDRVQDETRIFGWFSNTVDTYNPVEYSSDISCFRINDDQEKSASKPLSYKEVREFINNNSETVVNIVMDEFLKVDDRASEGVEVFLCCSDKKIHIVDNRECTYPCEVCGNRHCYDCLGKNRYYYGTCKECEESYCRGKCGDDVEFGGLCSNCKE